MLEEFLKSSLFEERLFLSRNVGDFLKEGGPVIARMWGVMKEVELRDFKAEVLWLILIIFFFFLREFLDQ